jgi:ATP-dependent DNA helicase DinG
VNEGGKTTRSSAQAGVTLAKALTAATASVGGEPRPGQELMAEAVAHALAESEHLLVQAGTGTGKSLAYLVPALLHATQPQARPVIVATATLALQRQLIDLDIPRVIDAVAPMLAVTPKAAVLKGRHHYLCRLRLDGDSASDSGEDALFDSSQATGAGLTEGRLSEQVREVRDWAEMTATGDRDDLPAPVDGRVWRAVSVTSRECVGRAKCPVGNECFAELARDQAREADVVITNHAMLAVEWIDGRMVLPEHDAVIVDEAHEWIDRATSAATLDLAPGFVETLVSGVRRQTSPDAAQELATAASNLDSSLRTHASSGGLVRWAGLPGDVAEAVLLIGMAARRALASMSGSDNDEAINVAANRQRLRANLDEVIAVCDRLGTADERHVLWLEERPVRVRVAPLSVAAYLRENLAETTVIATSATLDLRTTNADGVFGGVARSWGLAAGDWQGLDVGSPFDYARQGILYVGAHLPAPGRDVIGEETLDEIAELIEASGGSALSLFSSWRALERAGEYLRVRLAASTHILVQSRGDAVASLVDEFRATPGSVLLGTVSLWQGVDAPGDVCRLVTIDRIPFAPPDDPVLAARMEAADAAGGSGFAQVALPRAGVLLAQGVGRLIRSAEDRGVVAVLDPRLVTKGYGRQLQRSLPPLWLTTDAVVAKNALARLRGPNSPTVGEEQ